MNKIITKSEFDDAHYQKLITDTNKIGNSLLASVVNDKISEKKRKIAKINVTNEFSNYKQQIDRLKSLKIGFIHNVLNEQNLSELDVHLEVSEKLLTKIDQLISSHVLYDASGVLSKDEFDQLMNNRASLEMIHQELQNIPKNETAANQLESIHLFQQSLKDVIDVIDEKSSALIESSQKVLKDTSNVIDAL